MTNSNQDFFSLIDKSNHILIMTPLSSLSIDSIATSFALNYFLKTRKKEVTFLYQKAIPEKLSFLEKPESVIKDFSGSRDFLLIFNTQRNKILDINTQEKENEYIVKITPEKGSIDPRDFSFVPANFKYDLIITIGIKSLESLGKIYLENSDLFFETPKINIDHSESNENFGQLNIIEMTASSCAEVIAELLIEKNENEITKEIAQSLLTGIVAATESFQKPTTSPKSMLLAAKLMKYKADQATIIRHLYKTKPLSFMKLWGRIMARLNWMEKYKFAWSLISGEDFVQSHASESDIPFILEEVQKNFSQGQIFAIIYSYGNSRTKLQFKVPSQKIRQKLINLFDSDLINSESDEIFSVEIEEKDIVKTEKMILEKIKQLIEE